MADSESSADGYELETAEGGELGGASKVVMVSIRMRE